MDRPTGPLTLPVSAGELANATELADKRTFEQACNRKHLSGGGTGKRGNLVGRLVEVALLGYLEQTGDWWWSTPVMRSRPATARRAMFG